MFEGTAGLHCALFQIFHNQVIAIGEILCAESPVVPFTHIGYLPPSVVPAWILPYMHRRHSIIELICGYINEQAPRLKPSVRFKLAVLVRKSAHIAERTKSVIAQGSTQQKAGVSAGTTREILKANRQTFAFRVLYRASEPAGK
ncbi:hypothetical protein M1D80_09590 [Phyllobacteriaceae bacterium JZ32]